MPDPNEVIERPRRQVDPGRRDVRIVPAQRPISGPSFLGLGSDSLGDAGDHSHDVGYLLEDDEPKSRIGSVLLVLIIVAALGGVVWLKYSGAGKTWVPPWQKNTSQAQNTEPQPNSPPTQPATQATTPAPSQNPPDQAPVKPSAPEAASNPPAQNSGNPPAADAGDNKPQDDKDSQSQQASPPAQTSTQAKTDAPTKSADNTASGQPGHHPAATVIASSKTPPPTKRSRSDDADNSGSAVSKTSRAKPREAVAEVTPDDALVANAEKYLYGRGAPQNCARALTGLRTAADRQNARARSLLGTMYATGHCVSRDLPTAYRWFALASRQSSDNVWIQRNLELIWREMTPQERKLATARSE
jgi:hypothetical protein